MSMGRPLSQLCGAFHGRTEAFWGSLVEQPETLIKIAPKVNNKKHFTARLIFKKRGAPG